MSDTAEAILLVGRILFVVFFFNAALGHLTKGQMMIGYAQSKGMPWPALAAWPAGLWLLAGSVSVAVGIWPDLGALMLGAFPIPAAWFFHKYWTIEDEQMKRLELMSFLRNVTLLGAGVALFVFFATAGYGLDLTVTDPLFDLR